MSDALAFWRRMEALDVEQMNDAERLCYVLSALFAADVENGGFWQFFYNIDAPEYQEIVEGLRVIGALKTLDLLLQARAILPDGGQGALDAARDETLPNPSAFSEFDKQFSGEDVFERVEAYAASQGLFETPTN
ncbi:MAG: DUF4375 domain-containing protein [Proteobacteria bacterium]|nr:DUF4375 domain-containing protein [Pseudomonadota bacterium]